MFDQVLKDNRNLALAKAEYQNRQKKWHFPR